MVSKEKSRWKRPFPISRGRPPTANRSTSLSAKATRAFIRSHHQLNKERARALASGNQELVGEIDEKIESLGGLESYQLASKKGQSRERGGDSSRVLLDWIMPVLHKMRTPERSVRLLEIGSLSTRNACSFVNKLQVTRIDLRSQEDGILQQDFMERPLPLSETERFHIISLSLVLNYVDDPALRGQMLHRTVSFMSTELLEDPGDNSKNIFPCLFLVLPAACLLNSRYFNEERLKDIMHSIGYRISTRKVTSKLVFYLWKFVNIHDSEKGRTFRKEILNPGRVRNNFTVTLQPSGL